MNMLRIPTSNTTEATKVQAIINETYRDVSLKKTWWWRFKREIIVTANDITTGTVSVTNNSTAVSFSSAPTPSIANRKLSVTGNTLDPNAVYRISLHNAGETGATLDAVYTGATAATASYKVYDDEYDLASDFSELKWLKRFGQDRPIDFISPEEMFTIKQFDASEGAPQVVTVFDFATTGDPTTRRQLIVHPYPDEIYRLEVFYERTLNTELSGTTEPLIPDDYRQILVYGALARAFPVMLNDVERGTFYQNLFNDVLAVMAAKHEELSGSTPTVQPRDEHRRFYSRRRRITPATADLGSYFDRWPNSP